MIAEALKINSPSVEQAFLEWFSTHFKGNGLESKFHSGQASVYCTSFSENFQNREIAGHGYDPDSSMAALKAAAELVERRAVIEYFRRNPQEVLHNSSGWAVHLSRSSAIEAARREAIERHLLLYTYLCSGWSEFVLLDKRSTNNGTATFLVSPYAQNGYFAGLVVYRDNRFPGVSFGYLADHLEKIQTSPRWNHALFEAVGFVERGVETGGFLRASKNSIYNACRSWLLNSWQELEWKKELILDELPNMPIEIQSGSVAEFVPCYGDLSYARVKPGALVPLFTEEDFRESTRKKFVLEILARHGLSTIDGRTPIL